MHEEAELPRSGNILIPMGGKPMVNHPATHEPRQECNFILIKEVTELTLIELAKRERDPQKPQMNTD